MNHATLELCSTAADTPVRRRRVTTTPTRVSTASRLTAGVRPTLTVMKCPYVFLVLIVSLLAVSATNTASAQSRSTGIGFQVGEPTGITLKFVRPGVDYDFLAAWDLDDFLYLNAHVLFERRVDMDGDADLRMFYGPGAFIGFRDSPNDDAVLGATFTAGPSLWFGDVETFLQLTPRFELVPETDFDIGGGLGVRFHFR